jgi:hypothetical protein
VTSQLDPEHAAAYPRSAAASKLTMPVKKRAGPPIVSANPTPFSVGSRWTTCSGGVLYLATGEYKVRRFEVASGGKIVVDSRRGPVRVQVRELLKLGGSESAVDAGVPRLILRYDGRNDVLIHAPFAGALFAPHAAVSLSGEGRASGPSFASVFADTIVIGRGEVVRPLPLEWHTAAVLGVSFRNP